MIGPDGACSGTGYVGRREDPDDRRSRIVLLTDKDMDAIRPARRHINAIEREYSRTLGSAWAARFCFRANAPRRLR
ncbi:MAG TPA: hypothetical protein VIK54_06330 [Acidimicrobiia bacterium]